ncbi:hypothetical protein QNH39_23920 [Neobacillus novalis]|uniref:O-antigen ligase family protein n=2 Tax=Neobacillus novalis TaxID=220687 RepID=A0AA95MLZ1_9BACI|nr:hypothetical protein [Neobacillus novalis]WHY85622.1 hypothetical protein QNH39_23920 [Neobacillus novalis]
MRKINFILFTMIYFAASIVLMGSQYRPLSPTLIYSRYALILLGFFIIIVIYFKKHGLTIMRFPSFFSMYLFIIWILFGFSVILSEIIHHTFPFQGLFFLLIVPFIYFSVMPFMTKLGGPFIHHSLFTANLLYILISYLTVRVEFLPYSGIAANPNGFGQIAAITVIAGFFTLITLSNKGRLPKLLIIAAILLSLVSVIFSSSRTSFLVVGIITLIISVHFIMAKRNFKPLLIIMTIGLIGWFSPLKEKFLSGLLEKFASLNEAGNLFNGRTGTWQLVVKEASLFGHGDDYFEGFFEGAHNSLINILGVYGIIPTLLLAAFLLFLIVLAFINTFRKSQDKLAIFPFIIIVTFTLFSMTEAMFGLIGNGITIAFYHVVGLLLLTEGPKTMVRETNISP